MLPWQPELPSTQPKNLMQSIRGPDDAFTIDKLTWEI